MKKGILTAIVTIMVAAILTCAMVFFSKEIVKSTRKEEALANSPEKLKIFYGLTPEDLTKEYEKFSQENTGKIIITQRIVTGSGNMKLIIFYKNKP